MEDCNPHPALSLAEGEGFIDYLIWVWTTTYSKIPSFSNKDIRDKLISYLLFTIQISEV